MLASNKSIVERIVHAVGFEVIAVLICAPVGAWLLNRSMLEVGTLAVVLSTVAMLWNMLYNSVSDRLWPVERLPAASRCEPCTPAASKSALS